MQRHLKKARAQPKKGGLRHGHKSKREGLRHEHELKKKWGGGLAEKTILITDVAQKGGFGSLFINYLYFLSCKHDQLVGVYSDRLKKRGLRHGSGSKGGGGLRHGSGQKRGS